MAMAARPIRFPIPDIVVHHIAGRLPPFAADGWRRANPPAALWEGDSPVLAVVPRSGTGRASLADRRNRLSHPHAPSASHWGFMHFSGAARPMETDASVHATEFRRYLIERLAAFEPYPCVWPRRACPPRLRRVP